tara:strand:- start:4621 stop:5364 length:744 start_codon:yes stop_codon:yes gene_type:complete
MQKRGQVSTFVIVGLVILLLFGAVYFVISSTSPETDAEISTAPIQSFIQDCLDTTFKKAIAVTSSQGGYNHPPKPYFTFYFTKIPYYYDKEPLPLPTLSITEEEISEYVLNNIDFCLKDLQQFGKNVTIGPNKIKTTISPAKTTLDMHLPVTIESKKSKVEINEFSTTKTVQLGQAIALANDIIEEQNSFPNDIVTSTLVDLGEEHDVYIDLLHIDNTVIYSLIYANEEYYNDEYYFAFAIQYDWIK